MSANEDHLENLYAQLDSLEGSHRFDLIIAAAVKILALRPDDMQALYSLANAQYYKASRSADNEDFAEMRKTVDHALSKYPGVAEFHYLLHLYHLWYGGNQYVNGRDCLLEAIRLQPEAAFYQRALGEIYLINREADRAVIHLQEAVRLDPNTAEYRSRLALGFLRQHKISDCKRTAEQALHDAPDDMKVLDTVGMIYILLGDLEKADRFFRDAIRRDPTYNYFQQHMDWVKRELKDKRQREQQQRKYTPLYLRQKGTKRFFDEDSEKAVPVS